MTQKTPDSKCPNCGELFVCEDHFWWGEDEQGDPTIENVSCPECGASTVRSFSCEVCHQKYKCELEEGCPPCQYWRYEDFEIKGD